MTVTSFASASPGLALVLLASGDTAFTAGDRVILNEGFSVGDATMVVEIDRTLYPDAWVQDDTSTDRASPNCGWVGGITSTEVANELLFSNGWHKIDLQWQKSLGPGANTGSGYLCIDSVTPPVGCTVLSTLDNDTGAINFVRWGAIDVPSDSYIGFLDLDDFVSGPFSNNFESGNTDAWSSTSED